MLSKPTFLHQNKPLITCMVQAPDVAETLKLVRAAAYDGCDAYGFQYENFPDELRTDGNLRAVFSEMNGKPIYATNYRRGKTDEALAAGLLQMLSCGATLLDVMGDYYCPTPGELTEDEQAIQKQRALIDTIHARGGEVLMSSHVLKFTPAEEVLRIAKAHEARGADISKIVTAAETEEEELENLRITALLRKELSIPFLFLSGGSHCKLHRQIGPMLGCCMWLTVHHYDAYATPSQPLLHAIRSIADHFSYNL
ncbi:MAG: type I 3-dehydroquinate dehydratase [Eubacteriales bacterium]